MRAYPYLAEVLADKYDVDEDKIRPEATLADLGLDSLMAVSYTHLTLPTNREV